MLVETASGLERLAMTDAPESRSDRKHKGSRVGLIIVMVVAVVLLVAVAVGAWLLTRTEHPAQAGQKIEVRIPQGAGTEQIARMLSSYGVITNTLMFEVRAKLAKTPLRPGTYQFTTGMSDEATLKRLAAGPPQTPFFDIIIPAGFTAKQIAKRFAARAKVPEAEMTTLLTTGASQFEAKHPYLSGAAGGSLEGYLYPSTYRIKMGTKSAAIVEMMLGKFDAATAGLDLTFAKTKNLTLGDVVTIASILEREAKLSKDYPTVASVIYNRLHARMRLQLDSTVFYVAPEGTSRLTNTDLFNPSPYNTYRNYGLPPGPISNPGIDAINAAAHPSQTKYLYYVLTSKDGSQTFTVTYKEFLAAVKKYHQVFGQ